MAYVAQRIQRKTPEERIPLTFDFGSDSLPSGETIVSVVGNVITPSGELVVDSVGYSDTSVDIWVTGGNADSDYIVDCRVQTTPSAVILAATGLVQVRTR